MYFILSMFHILIQSLNVRESCIFTRSTSDITEINEKDAITTWKNIAEDRIV